MPMWMTAHKHNICIHKSVHAFSLPISTMQTTTPWSCGGPTHDMVCSPRYFTQYFQVFVAVHFVRNCDLCNTAMGVSKYLHLLLLCTDTGSAGGRDQRLELLHKLSELHELWEPCNRNDRSCHVLTGHFLHAHTHIHMRMDNGLPSQS